VAVFRKRSDKGFECLVCKREYPPAEGEWVIPGGHANEGESIEDAAHREMKEETKLDLGRLVYIKDMPNETGKKQVTVYGTTLPDGERATAGDDAEKVKWVPLDDLPPLGLDNDKLVREIARKMKLLPTQEGEDEVDWKDAVGELDGWMIGPQGHSMAMAKHPETGFRLLLQYRTTVDNPINPGTGHHIYSVELKHHLDVKERQEIAALNMDGALKGAIDWANRSPYFREVRDHWVEESDEDIGWKEVTGDSGWEGAGEGHAFTAHHYQFLNDPKANMVVQKKFVHPGGLALDIGNLVDKYGQNREQRFQFTLWKETGVAGKNLHRQMIDALVVPGIPDWNAAVEKGLAWAEQQPAFKRVYEAAEDDIDWKDAVSPEHFIWTEEKWRGLHDEHPDRIYRMEAKNAEHGYSGSVTVQIMSMSSEEDPDYHIKWLSTTAYLVVEVPPHSRIGKSAHWKSFNFDFNRLQELKDAITNFYRTEIVNILKSKERGHEAERSFVNRWHRMLKPFVYHHPQ